MSTRISYKQLSVEFDRYGYYVSTVIYRIAGRLVGIKFGICMAEIDLQADLNWRFRTGSPYILKYMHVTKFNFKDGPLNHYY